MGMSTFESLLYESGYNKGFKDGIKGSILKVDYETRLKADMVAMLKELKKEIEEQCKIPNNNASAYDWNNGVYACYKVVQQKINELKENIDES